MYKIHGHCTPGSKLGVVASAGWSRIEIPYARFEGPDSLSLSLDLSLPCVAVSRSHTKFLT